MTPRLLLAAVPVLVLGAGLIAIESRRATAEGERRMADSSLPQVWSDEFEGPAGARPDRRNWGFETGYGWGDGELQAYTTERANASLDGKGRLAITARPERRVTPDGVASYTSARLTTRRRLEFAYGRLEARMKVPAGRGLLSAFWALGSNYDSVGWPAAGEIDVMEVKGTDPATVSGTLHGALRNGRAYTVGAERTAGAPLSDAFHVYGISWSPRRMAFTLDGEVYAVLRPADLPGRSRWTFDHPFFLLFTLSVRPRWMEPPDQTTPWPATILVDWVRIWRSESTFCPVVRARERRSRCPRIQPRP
jgi:beta-glucanase (GH16 family)